MSERITTVNLHTHTRRCKHARGIPADYAKAAEEKGIRVLGMTDHTPFPDDRVIMIRMGIAELNDYIRVTTPSVWLALIAIILLLAGFLAWGALGTVTVTTEDGRTETIHPITIVTN